MMPFLDAIRETLVATIKESLPDPQAPLLLGTILGIKSGFSPDFYEALRVTGTLHVVVISGYNISVIINTLARILGFVPLKVRFALTLGFVFLFVLLVGPEAPVVRAAIMGTIALLGTVLGRQGDALRALFASGLIMVALSPEWVTELSFQLSFLATLGLIILFPLFDRVLPGKGMFLREDLVTTMAAQVMVWPLIAYHFGQVSLLSPIVNTLVLWTIPIITYLGLVTATIGSIVNGIPSLIMIPVRPFLDFFVWIVNLFSSWEVGYFEVSAFSLSGLILYFAILGGGIWFLHQTLAKKQK